MLRIPIQIRVEIFELYLQSYSLHEISRIVKVSVGTVKNVVDSFIKKELDYMKIRKIFENVEKNNVDKNKIILALRIINKIDKTQLSYESLLAFLDGLETEGFRLDIDINIFISRISSLLFFEREEEIRIEDYNNYIDEKKEEIKQLEEKRKIEERKNRELLKKSDMILKDLEEYNKNKKIILEYTELKNQNKLPKEFDWIAHEYQYSEASNILKRNLVPRFLYSCLNRIYLEPEKYTDIIKIITDRFNYNTTTNKKLQR
jgi:hypothetical protein